MVAGTGAIVTGGNGHQYVSGTVLHSAGVLAVLMVSLICPASFNFVISSIRASVETMRPSRSLSGLTVNAPQITEPSFLTYRFSVRYRGIYPA